MTAVLEYGFASMGLNRVEALVDPRNAASAGSCTSWVLRRRACCASTSMSGARLSTCIWPLCCGESGDGSGQALQCIVSNGEERVCAQRGHARCAGAAAAIGGCADLGARISRLGSGHRPAHRAGQEFCALSPAEQDRALEANAEILLSAAQELNYAALTVPGNYWEIAPGEPAFYWLPPEARFRQIELLQRAGSEDLMLVAGSGGVMSMPGASNYVEFCYQLFDAPEEIDRRAAQTLEHGLEMAKRLRDLGIEAVFTASDIADNRGLFFNPDQMERFILPYLRRWAAAVKEMGLYTILHTDGDVGACLEDLAESGIDALQAIDPVAGMDIRQVKDAGGRPALPVRQRRLWPVGDGHAREVYAATRDCWWTARRVGGWCWARRTRCSPRCRSPTIGR